MYDEGIAALSPRAAAAATELRLCHVRFLLQRKRAPQAHAAAAAAAAVKQADPRIYTLWVRSLVERGLSADAAAVAETAVREQPQSADLWELRWRTAADALSAGASAESKGARALEGLIQNGLRAVPAAQAAPLWCAQLALRGLRKRSTKEGSNKRAK